MVMTALMSALRRGCLSLVAAIGIFAAPVQAASVTLTAASATSVTASIAPDASDVGKPANIWMGAIFQGVLYLRDGSTWTRHSGGPYPVATSIGKLLASNPVTVVDQLDISALAGLDLYVGYGASEQDMLSSPGKLAKIHTVPATAEVLKSGRQRIAAPTTDAGDLTTLTRDNSALAFKLYQLLKDQEGNIFYSPHSISLALAMTYAGARSETERLMANAMQFTLPQSRLHPALNALDLELATRARNAGAASGEGFSLNVVNALWGQKDYPFLPSFLDVLAENYGAGLRMLDFQTAPDASRITINDWVSAQTASRITDLIPQGAITELTRLVLTNAIYFKAAWQKRFDTAATSAGVFHLLDGRDATVSMMRETASLAYAEGDNYQAVELPYEGGKLSMVILLPQSGQFSALEKLLDAGVVGDVIARLRPTQIALTMPKFEFRSSFSLKNALTALGMGAAFTDGADFSGMAGNKALSISDLLHKAFVSLDEKGTEAAAATAVIVGATSMPLQPRPLAIDRPFVFLIRDIPTGAILFLGRVVNPG